MHQLPFQEGAQESPQGQRHEPRCGPLVALGCTAPAREVAEEQQPLSVGVRSCWCTRCQSKGVPRGVPKT